MPDLRGGLVTDWLVIGWFTPDYQPLAERFAANLDNYSIPFHLFSRPKVAQGWNTLQKPSVVLEAMNVYPDRTLVLMDVDCIVRGDVSPVTAISSDVAIVILSRMVWLLWPLNQRPTIDASSRVVVFRPTEGARSFAQEWDRLCQKTKHDEVGLVQTFLTHRGSTYNHIAPHYIGREVSQSTADDVIVHDSAHDRLLRQAPQSIAARLKAIERHFRTGRTKIAKQRGLG